MQMTQRAFIFLIYIFILFIHSFFPVCFLLFLLKKIFLQYIVIGYFCYVHCDKTAKNTIMGISVIGQRNQLISVKWTPMFLFTCNSWVSREHSYVLHSSLLMKKSILALSEFLILLVCKHRVSDTCRSKFK